MVEIKKESGGKESKVTAEQAIYEIMMGLQATTR